MPKAKFKKETEEKLALNLDRLPPYFQRKCECSNIVSISTTEFVSKCTWCGASYNINGERSLPLARRPPDAIPLHWLQDAFEPGISWKRVSDGEFLWRVRYLDKARNLMLSGAIRYQDEKQGSNKKVWRSTVVLDQVASLVLHPGDRHTIEAAQDVIRDTVRYLLRCE